MNGSENDCMRWGGVYYIAYIYPKSKGDTPKVENILSCVAGQFQ